MEQRNVLVLTDGVESCIEIFPCVFGVVVEDGGFLKSDDCYVSLSPEWFNPNRKISTVETRKIFLEPGLLEDLLSGLSDMLLIDMQSSLGALPLSNLWNASLIASATQQGSFDFDGFPLFEASRQLVVDLEIALGEFNWITQENQAAKEAAWLYLSIGPETTNFYRSLDVKDFANWGLSKRSHDLLRFISEAGQRHTPQEIKSLSEARDVLQIDQSRFEGNAARLRRISADGSARLIELCRMNQYLRFKWLERNEYFEYLRRAALWHLNYLDEECFYNPNKNISDLGEFSSEDIWYVWAQNVTNGAYVNMQAVGNLDLMVDYILGPIPWKLEHYAQGEIAASDFFFFAYLAVLVEREMGNDVCARLDELWPHYEKWVETAAFSGAIGVDFSKMESVHLSTLVVDSKYGIPGYMEALFIRFYNFFEFLSYSTPLSNRIDDLWKSAAELSNLDLLGAAFIVEVEYRRKGFNGLFMDTDCPLHEIYKPVVGRFAEKASSYWRKANDIDGVSDA